MWKRLVPHTTANRRRLRMLSGETILGTRDASRRTQPAHGRSPGSSSIAADPPSKSASMKTAQMQSAAHNSPPEPNQLTNTPARFAGPCVSSGQRTLPDDQGQVCDVTLASLLASQSSQPSRPLSIGSCERPTIKARQSSGRFKVDTDELCGDHTQQRRPLSARSSIESAQQRRGGARSQHTRNQPRQPELGGAKAPKRCFGL